MLQYPAAPSDFPSKQGTLALLVCIGATFGHYYDNWLVDDYRKAVVYAICWTEHLPIPVDGIQTTWVEDAVVGEALGSTPSPNLSPLEPTRPPPDPAYAKK